MKETRHIFGSFLIYVYLVLTIFPPSCSQPARSNPARHACSSISCNLGIEGIPTRPLRFRFNELFSGTRFRFPAILSSRTSRYSVEFSIWENSICRFLIKGLKSILKDEHMLIFEEILFRID